MRNKNIYFYIGTTAELIKLAPVIREFRKRKVKFKIITSGQNKVLFEDFLGYLGPIKVDIAFREKGEKSSVFYFILWAIRTFFVSLFSLRKEFKGLNKDNSYFIVHGDTVSSLLGALVASIYGLRLVHIESGLRSFNFFEPFPEEISRYIISHLADVHFCPNKWSVNNLQNTKGTKINTKQNTLIESFRMAIRAKGNQDNLKKIKKKYFVLVLHRQEHTIFRKKQTEKILDFVLRHADENFACVFIMHNLTSSFLKSTTLNLNVQKRKKIIATPRLPYIEFIKLINKAGFFVTDGGSNQEEAYYLGKPCLILRNRTERIEGLGGNAVLSRNKKKIIKDFLSNYKKYKKKRVQIKTFPSKIVVDYLINH